MLPVVNPIKIEAAPRPANHPNSPKQMWARIRNSMMEATVKEIPRQYSPNLLKILGSALYWAEGYKPGFCYCKIRPTGRPMKIPSGFSLCLSGYPKKFAALFRARSLRRKITSIANFGIKPNVVLARQVSTRGIPYL